MICLLDQDLTSSVAIFVFVTGKQSDLFMIPAPCLEGAGGGGCG